MSFCSASVTENYAKAVITSGQSIPVPESTTQYANSTGVNNNGNITFNAFRNGARTALN